MLAFDDERTVDMGELISAIGANIETLNIVLFALGIICLTVEMFEPGFGVFGGAGIVLMIVDIIILADNIGEAVFLFFALALLVLFFVLLFFILASCGIIPKKLVLDSKVIEKNNNAIESKVAVGDTGKSVTRLVPSGKAEFGGITVDVVSNGEFIEPDSSVRVCEVSGNRIVVCRVQ